jgi:hypothetical protein
MLIKIKKRLPLIGATCLFILTLVNFLVEDDLIVGIVGAVLFLFVIILSIITSRSTANRTHSK